MRDIDGSRYKEESEESKEEEEGEEEEATEMSSAYLHVMIDKRESILPSASFSLSRLASRVLRLSCLSSTKILFQQAGTIKVIDFFSVQS